MRKILFYIMLLSSALCWNACAPDDPIEEEDDDKEIAALIIDRLDDEGYEVILAHDGLDAIDSINSNLDIEIKKSSLFEVSKLKKLSLVN